MIENSKQIGQRIKKLREEIGMSQHDLAARLDILRPTISQMENGERKIRADELMKLSEILNTSAQYLMGIEDKPEVVLQERREKMKDHCSCGGKLVLKDHGTWIGWYCPKCKMGGSFSKKNQLRK